MWEVVYEKEPGPYGSTKVGLKIPGKTPNVIWLAMDGYGFPEGSSAEFTRMEDYAKEICGHMNSLRKTGGE